MVEINFLHGGNCVFKDTLTNTNKKIRQENLDLYAVMNGKPICFPGFVYSHERQAIWFFIVIPLYYLCSVNGKASFTNGYARQGKTKSVVSDTEIWQEHGKDNLLDLQGKATYMAMNEMQLHFLLSYLCRTFVRLN